MGTSTDAILFFGVLLPDEESDDFVPYPWVAACDEDMDWWDALAIRAGVPYPQHLDGLAEWTPAQEAEFRAYQQRRDTVASAFGCDIVEHCSAECPMYGVALKHRTIVAHRGYGERIDPDRLSALDRDKEAIVRFLGAIGYTPEQVRHIAGDDRVDDADEIRHPGIGWWLVSNWS